MMKKYIVALAILMFVCQLRADVVIRLQTKASPATTQPTANESAVSVSAVPGHQFATSFQFEGRTISVNGDIANAAGNGQYRINVNFADHDRQGDCHEFKTAVELKENDSVEVAKMQSAGSIVSTMLTVTASKR